MVANMKEFEKILLQMIEEQKTKEFQEDSQMKHQKPNTTILLRALKSLIHERKIDIQCRVIRSTNVLMFIVLSSSV